MAEPQTVNCGIIVPNVGDLINHWGDQALNPDFVAVDGYLGGLQTVSVGTSAVLLTSPAGFTPTPGSGPTQSQNAILRITGTLTSTNVVITLPLPGFMIVENLTTGPQVVILRAIGSGELIGIEQGVVQHVYNDGTNVRFVNLPTVGSYMDICDATVPGWINACTKPPWLYCNGGTFSAVTYPYLNAKLGGTTLPDFRGRAPIYFNDGTGRTTSGGAGIDGNTRFAAGGNNGISLGTNNLPPYTPSGSVSSLVTGSGNTGMLQTGTGGVVNIGGTGSGGSLITGGGLISSNFSGAPQGGTSANITNAAPGVVSGLRLIRAA
jgi:hypothetical protein